MATTVVVDLDGTLVRTDLLVEGLISALIKYPHLIFFLPFWLLKGKPFFKERVASYADLDPNLLPYQPDVLDLIRSRINAGDRVILATAAQKTIAQLVASYLGCFDVVLATTSCTNLSGMEKLHAIQRALHDASFDYVGNSKDDVEIWAAADEVIVVEPSRGVVTSVRRRLKRDPDYIIGVSAHRWLAFVRALRPHQWLKNLLVFVALIAAHEWHDLSAWRDVLLLFVAFSITASSIYIFNDLLDLKADRRHPRKRLRPFAAGDVPLMYGVVASPLLVGIGLAIAMAISLDTLLFLLSYASASMAYGIYFKRLVVLDVMILAGLYTVRVIAGAVAIDVELSFWLLAFSMFVFLSLAVMKRAAELDLMARSERAGSLGRDYRVVDIETVRALGIASGGLSVLVLAMYINTPEVKELYATVQPLWVLCVLLLYWLGRLWVKTDRGEMHDDPIVFALKDWNSRFVAAVCAMCILVATTGLPL